MVTILELVKVQFRLLKNDVTLINKTNWGYQFRNEQTFCTLKLAQNLPMREMKAGDNMSIHGNWLMTCQAKTNVNIPNSRFIIPVSSNTNITQYAPATA